MDISNATVKIFDGFLTDFATANEANYLIRGIRNVVDFEYEKNLMIAYQSMNPDIEVFYLISQSSLSFVSSTFVKEVKSLNGDVKKYIRPSAFDLVEKIY
jgi:pantetheine-phosphate adenylyltransferase